jgi:serine/threonine protein kinase
LKRDVAIKVLPDSFGADPERLARFQREAELLASLNHPHIAGIYGLEDSGGVRGLVLELVEGRRLPSASPPARYQSTKRFRSRFRLPTRSKRRTKRALSIAGLEK